MTIPRGIVGGKCGPQSHWQEVCFEKKIFALNLLSNFEYLTNYQNWNRQCPDCNELAALPWTIAKAPTMPMHCIYGIRLAYIYVSSMPSSSSSLQYCLCNVTNKLRTIVCSYNTKSKSFNFKEHFTFDKLEKRRTFPHKFCRKMTDIFNIMRTLNEDLYIVGVA